MIRVTPSPGRPCRVEDPVHVAVVGDPHGRLAVRDRRGDDVADARCAVEHRVLGVLVQVDEAVRHLAPVSLPGTSPPPAVRPERGDGVHKRQSCDSASEYRAPADGVLRAAPTSPPHRTCSPQVAGRPASYNNATPAELCSPQVAGRPASYNNAAGWLAGSSGAALGDQRVADVQPKVSRYGPQIRCADRRSRCSRPATAGARRSRSGSADRRGSALRCRPARRCRGTACTASPELDTPIAWR